jgi:hypothetical protein
MHFFTWGGIFLFYLGERGIILFLPRRQRDIPFFYLGERGIFLFYLKEGGNIPFLPGTEGDNPCPKRKGDIPFLPRREGDIPFLSGKEGGIRFYL